MLSFINSSYTFLFCYYRWFLFQCLCLCSMGLFICVDDCFFFFSSRRRHTSCALVTGVQTCALPISAGVNRVSIGVQSFDPQVLEFLGRAHSGDEARAAIAAAQEHFARVSFDLIYARPGQSLAAWEAELGAALAFGTGHLSLYQLTIEPGTRFATLAAKGELVIPDGDAAADLFDATQAMTRAAGLPRYEVSNHARPGEESRHNLTYWRYGDYAGLGPGAHGRRLAQATERHRKPERSEEHTSELQSLMR